MVDENVLAGVSFANELDNIRTPAFVLDEGILINKLEIAEKIHRDTQCNMLYALKPLANRDIMQRMLDSLQGFSGSSLYEVIFAREILGNKGSIHISTPGYRPDEINDLAEICDHIVLNSYTQYKNYVDNLVGKTDLGLRINPHVSNVKDIRYNPCRFNSKLGVPLANFMQLIALNKHDKSILQGVSGIQFHSNCDSTNYQQLLDNYQQLATKIGDFLPQLKWVNIGGGYLLEEEFDYEPFYAVVDNLINKFGVEVYFEPGAAYVRDAGHIVSTVIDKFVTDGGEELLILDTSINHMQEVFEYQFSPYVYGHIEAGDYRYILAGSTCLAGDLFGTYNFKQPINVGDRVIFGKMGAYTHVKSHMFNGVNMPNIYWFSKDKILNLRKSFTYKDYISRIY